jgi:hypothetical protein
MDMVAFVVGASSQSSEADMGEAMKLQFRRPVFDIMSTTSSAPSLWATMFTHWPRLGGGATDASDTDPFLPVPTHSRLGEVLHLFYSQGIHRYRTTTTSHHLMSVAVLFHALTSSMALGCRWSIRKTTWWAL